MVTVALPHVVHARLTLPFVSVASMLDATTPDAVIAPFVTVRDKLVALILATWMSPFTVMIWTVLKW